jgi:uncharacterized integral membrane protein
MTTPPAGDQNTGSGIPSQGPAPGQMPAQHVVKRTRMGGVWVASALFAVVLLLLLIFILENGQKVDIGYFGAHGHLPLGVALLLAAVLGVLLVVIPGTGRIVQLRILARRHRRMDGRRAAAAPPAAAGQPVAGPQAARSEQQAQPIQQAQPAQPEPGQPAFPEQPVPPTQYRP